MKLLKWFILSIVIIGLLSFNQHSFADAASSANKQKLSKEKNDIQKIQKEYSMPHFGQSISVGSAKIILKDAGFNKYFSTSEYDINEANGIYIETWITATNTGKDAINLDPEMFKIISSDGTKYSADIKATLLYRYNFEGLTLNPGVSYTGLVVFDVPAQTYKEQQEHKDFYLRFTYGTKHSDILMKHRHYFGDTANINPYVSVSVGDKSQAVYSKNYMGIVDFTAKNNSDHTIQVKDSQIRLITPNKIIYPDTSLEINTVKQACQLNKISSMTVCKLKNIKATDVWPSIQSGKGTQDTRVFDLPEDYKKGYFNSYLLQVQDGYGWVTFTLSHPGAGSSQ